MERFTDFEYTYEVRDVVNPSAVQMAREDIGCSQTALAQKLGISRAALASYESGRRRAPREFASKLAELADWGGVRDLYTWDVTPSS